MTPKELVKLAAACKKAGIVHYRCGDIEFTLGPVEQSTAVSRGQNQTDVQGNVESDELTDDQLLNWSIMDVPQADTVPQ